MKKIKIILMSLAVITAISFAYATKPNDICVYSIQYWYDGTYHEAGENGVDYACWTMPGTCTYYKPDPINYPNTYAPCRSGVIQLFGLAEKKESKSSR